MFNGFFTQALDREFHRSFKRDFYAWLYNNAKAKKVYHDFGCMYLMGGEL